MARVRSNPRTCLPRRRGVTALLAMLYLILFSTLALGFYASTMMAIQVTRNDARGARSMVAAESGMDFMRVAMSQVATSGSSGTALLTEVKNALAAKLEPTGNLTGRTLGWDGSSLITVPSIALDSSSAFSATVQLDGTGTKVVVRATGSSGGGTSAARGTSMTFSPQGASSGIFNFGVATRSAITMDSNARIRGLSDANRGSVLITATGNPAISMNSNASVSGKVSLINSAGTAITNSDSMINGTKSPVYGTHVMRGVSEPEFPTVDTAAFAPYATNNLTVVGKKYDTTDLKNIRIKANTNPTFSGSINVRGVIFIETPNKVTFDSNVVIRGVIAVQNNPTGTVTGNTIRFDSNVKLYSVDTLPATADYPAALRAMTGSMILAPKFHVTFNSAFGASGGSMVASRMTFDSNAAGTVTGSVINLENTALSLNGNADIAIVTPPAGYAPAGLNFSSKFNPDVSTYAEY